MFIIGARINSKWHAVKALVDLGGRRGMNHMLKYLTEHPEKGLLGYETMGFANVQYWRSFEHLEAFAKDTDDPHLEVWRNYWKRVGKSGRTGIWHETYLVRDGEYEAIYGNMPPRGLGKAAHSCRSPNRSAPASGSRRHRADAGRSEERVPAIRVVIVGGVAGGMSTATRLRRLDADANITVLERSGHVSFANCGCPTSSAG